MKLLKQLWYGLWADYHLNKMDGMNKKHKTVLRFHYEMAQHYYEKAYGKEWDGKVEVKEGDVK